MPETLTPEQQVSEVRKLKDEQDLSFQEIAERLGFSERTARRRYAATQIRQAAEVLAGEEEMDTFPEVEVKPIVVKGNFIPQDKTDIDRFKPLVRTGDAMVTCDWHIPLHDPVLINAMIECARKNKIKNLIIAGDYFHMEEFSSFLPYQPEAALEIEKHDGNLIMKTLCRTFDTIDIIWGNHDFRLARKLGYKKSFEECMDWMLDQLTVEERAKLRISSLDHMFYYPIADKKWYVCHQSNFSKVPLTVPRSLAQKYSCSVFSTHSHHCALGMAHNGVDICIEGGGFFSKSRTEYIQKSTDNHEWVPGFTMFKEGVPTVVSPAFGNHTPFLKEVK